MAGTEVSNAAGGRVTGYREGTGATRSEPQKNPRPAPAPGPTDEQLANDARQAKAKGDHSTAKAKIAQIRDPDTERKTYNDLYGGEKAVESPPAKLFKDGSGSLEDPLSLFFMMVFYLKEFSPTFKWSDVLKTAKDNAGANSSFSNIEPSDKFLPSRSYSDSGNATAATGITGQLQAQQNENREQLNKQKQATSKDLNKQRDATKDKVDAQRGSGASGKGPNAGPVVVWPIQCMPVINSGLNKSVDWPNNQVATLAEPTIALNKGSSSIEIDVEFTYAVGVFGVGDAEIVAQTGGIDPVTGQPSQDSTLPPPGQNKGWSIEEIMGMIYLATSLVYPFKSNSVVAAKKDAPVPQDDRQSAQYPVLFMRHYSLFPFLTPFVVKAVKIEPDENQPLLITEPVNLKNGIENHLTFPAVRQVVKITLSLVSAHYYLPIFGGKDEDDQIKKQTSGETYLQLAKGLLGKRVP